MEIQELRSLQPALEKFVAQFDPCIKTTPSRQHLRTYLNGQLGPLDRKSIEPIALDAGVHVRNLQEFLSIHRWDEVAVRDLLRMIIVRDHGDPNAIGVIDETSFPKKGKMTAGVQRQHCGATGKTDNCVVTVHMGYVVEDFHAIIDGDLYLPKETWAEDRIRCRAAGIPDEVVYRPKWQIAVDLLRRTLNSGVPMQWLTADEGYGRAREFREAVKDMGLSYVVEIPSSISGWSREPKVEPQGTVTKAGKVLTKPRVNREECDARKVSKLWLRGGPSWQKFLIKTTEKGPVVWEVRESPFFANNSGVPGTEERLLVAREVLTGEVKYFLCHAPKDVPLKILLLVAFSRWHIERLFEDGKGEIGFDQFEVRCYRSLMRHLILSTVSLYFLCEQTTRLRKKKSGVDDLPGADGGRGSAGPEDVST